MREDWETKTLGEIATIKGGKRVPKGYKFETTPTLHPYITVADFTENGTVCTKKIKYISNEVYEQIRNYTISSQDLYISIAGTIGKTGSVPQSLNGANLTENACKLVFQKGVNKRFVYYFTKTNNFVQQTNINTRIAAQPKLALVRLKIITLPVPPLSEQKRIVAVLDEAFEGIDRAIANTEKNLSNARELFESYLNAIFTQQGDGWIKKKLAEIGGKVLTGPFGSLLHKADYVSYGTPLVNPANIEGDQIVPDFHKTVNQDALNRLKSYTLREGDIVIGRRGEIGRCAVVKKEQSGWLCGTGSFFIQPSRYVNSTFLAHLVRSTTYRSKLEALSTGATMKNLNNQSLSNLVIALPTLDEQNQLIEKLNDLRIETQRLESIYQQKLAALNELKQSILQKAFTGELTADTTNQATKAVKEVVAA